MLLGLVACILIDLLHGIDEALDQVDPILVGLTAHYWQYRCLYFADVLQALHLESLDDLCQDLVALLLGLTVISKYLHMLHQCDVILPLQAALLQDGNEDIELPVQLLSLDATIILPFYEFCEGCQKHVIEGAELCNRGEVLQCGQDLLSLSITHALLSDVEVGQASDVGHSDALETLASHLDLIGDHWRMSTEVNRLAEGAKS